MLFAIIYWDPSRALSSWQIPFLDRPVLWYGLCFAIGFFLSYLVFQSLLKEFLASYRITKKASMKVAEKICFYVVIGTLLGARLGDVLFYQNPAAFMHNPLGIFQFWEPGLSSHGGVMGILLCLWICSVRLRKTYPMLTWIAMLDLLAIPALLAGGFIRIGNFFNQEILGTASTLPWAVIFGHPADGSPLIPRHPVQLYEALFYFLFFGVLLALRKKVPKMFRLGKTAGLFFIGTFSFRFLIEFVKLPQSALLPRDSVLDMGQWLSLPFILMGLILFFFEHYGLRARFLKGHQG